MIDNWVFKIQSRSLSNLQTVKRYCVPWKLKLKLMTPTNIAWLMSREQALLVTLAWFPTATTRQFTSPIYIQHQRWLTSKQRWAKIFLYCNWMLGFIKDLPHILSQLLWIVNSGLDCYIKRCVWGPSSMRSPKYGSTRTALSIGILEDHGDDSTAGLRPILACNMLEHPAYYYHGHISHLQRYNFLRHQRW